MPRTILISMSVLLLSLSGSAEAAFVVYSVGGDATTASIQATVDQFRADLGNPNNGNAAGPLASGRREINWDGGGSLLTAPGGTPFTVFQNNRGATMTTPGTGFVQATPAGLATDFNPTYATTFSAFSPSRVFTPVGSNLMDVTFSIPGSGGAQPAVVRGFGAVFSDVDLAGLTRLQLFDVNNVELFNQAVLPGAVSSGSLSFLGAIGNAGEQIARVRITTGNAALGPNDGPLSDVVVADDFLFAEPAAFVPPGGGGGVGVPTPASLGTGGMIGAAVLLGAVKRRWRRGA